MRGRAFGKLFFTDALQRAKDPHQLGCLLKESLFHSSCHELPQREVLGSSVFTRDAPASVLHQDCGTDSLITKQQHLFPPRSHLTRTIVHHPHLCCQGHRHLHRAHFSTSSSADIDADSKSTVESLPAKGTKHRNALTLKLKALCESSLSDREALHALEASVLEIKECDDPEGLLAGAAYLKLATVYGTSHSPDIMKGLLYAKKAVNAYVPRGPTLKLATSYYILALIYITMGDCQGALVQLEESECVMRRMKVTPCDKYCVALKHDVQTVMGEACDQFCNEVKFEVQSLLGVAKLRLGRHDEAAAHINKSVKFKQKLLQAGSSALGMFYVDTAEDLKLVNDHKTAALLCRRAVKILSKCYGCNSVGEAKARSLLSNIYYDLGKFEESLAQSKSARRIWKHLGKVEELICSSLNAERSLVCLHMWNEAISMLEEVIEATEPGNKSQGIALILAARVCVLSNNDDSATRYFRRALEALEHQGPCVQMAGTLLLLSVAYEDRKEFQQAAVVCEKAKEVFDQCPGSEAVTTAAEVEGKVGCLLVHAGRHEAAILPLENSISKLKHVLGKDLLYAHFYLGLAYPQVQKYQEALEQFEAAKRLSNCIEVGIPMQVAIYSNLAATYSAVCRLDEAIECQKVVVDLLKVNTVEDYTLEEVKMRLTAYIQEGEALKESAWHNRRDV
ncbi:hypothetical protein GOP47_0006085 [Adiantum capillus-veneris]|uniref:Uncharacterized protein n=1 Tax=Adiantum capillus-veneris TaxID=13818 RepID=A0A9D4ZK26_ADICA|nr:hypothetical protein GOP47_0006085 [Adiantum capillus-veneris]